MEEKDKLIQDDEKDKLIQDIEQRVFADLTADPDPQDPIIIIRPGNSVQISLKTEEHQLSFQGTDPRDPSRVLWVFSKDRANLEDHKAVSSVYVQGSNPSNYCRFVPGADGIFMLVISYPL